VPGVCVPAEADAEPGRAAKHPGVDIELRNMEPQRKAEDLQHWAQQQQQVGGTSRYSMLAAREDTGAAKGDRYI